MPLLYIGKAVCQAQLINLFFLFFFLDRRKSLVRKDLRRRGQRRRRNPLRSKGLRQRATTTQQHVKKRYFPVLCNNLQEFCGVPPIHKLYEMMKVLHKDHLDRSTLQPIAPKFHNFLLLVQVLLGSRYSFYLPYI